MRTVLSGGALAAAVLAPWGLAAGATQPAWFGYAGNAQHTAPAPAAAQNLTKILWSTPVDLDPQYQDDELLIHYASPMITGHNTVLIAVKTGATGGWQTEAHAAATGTRRRRGRRPMMRAAVEPSSCQDTGLGWARK